MKKKQFSIAVLLPTRGRTDALKRSVISIINRVVKPKEVQLLLAFDNDDEIGTNYFIEEIQPWLDSKGIDYTALTFDSMGYEGLNRYYNAMAEHADADWLFVWNDDAIMETSSWDNVVRKYDGQIKILKVHTHGEHPYSIFPIVPADVNSPFAALSSNFSANFATFGSVIFAFPPTPVITPDANTVRVKGFIGDSPATRARCTSV